MLNEGVPPWYIRAVQEVYMNPIIQSIFDRKSVRAFTDEPITQEEKDLLIEAAFQAPSGGNQQPYVIIDVTDQAMKEELAELCDHQPFIATAKVVFIFIADGQRWMDAYHEAGLTPRAPGISTAVSAANNALIAAQNVVMAAESMGIGSCYIGDILENCEKVKELLNLPEYAFPAGMLVFGRPTQQQKDRQKPKRFPKKYMVYENQYHQLDGEELRDLFSSKCGSQTYEEWVTAMCKRKYESDFALEMSRSVKKWLEPFKG